jgi:CHAD domain-containing protein
MSPPASEFLLPEGMTIEGLRRLLSEHVDVRDGEAGSRDRRFYDTFDGLVRESGMSCEFEDGRLGLVSASASAGDAAPLVVECDQAPDHVLALDLAEGPLRDALIRTIDVRALSPIAHVRSRSAGLGVLNSDGKTVVRLTLEEPAAIVASSSRREVALRPRLRVAAVRGYGSELEAVSRSLADELGLVLADESLADEAVRAGGGEPSGVSSKIDVPLEYGERADAAAVSVLKRLLEVIEVNLPGTLADVDSEFLHDFRVSVRRSRAVQRELKRVFPGGALAGFRDEFRWLQRATGDARDLDVYVLEFDTMRGLLPVDMRADVDPLLSVLRGRRMIARGELVQALRSARTRELLIAWRVFLAELVLLPSEDRPDAARPIGDVTGERISKVYKQMVRMGRAIGRDSPPEEYHELRKKGKELRYLLELFGAPLFADDVVKPMIRSLKAMQDVLGRHQDREVQIAMLRSLRDEVSALPGGPAALMAMGVLVQRLGQDVLTARGDFASRFAEFASSDARRLVRETFS